MPERLAQLLEPFGTIPESVVDLRAGATPESLPYLDLLSSEGHRPVPDGVVESRGEPVAYVVDQESRPPVASLSHLRKTLTLRGDAPYLVVLEPGRLTIYDTSWQDDPDPAPLDTVKGTEARAQTTFQRLSLALIEEGGDRSYVQELLFKLLNAAVDGLIQGGIDRDDAISLAGRSLFMRFLIDRKIVGEAEINEICPKAASFEEIFSGPESAEATCAWLDRTFNGDFLPLSFLGESRGFKKISRQSFVPLEDVMYRSPGGQLLLKWGDLDFAHVPVGLLSQVYERQAEAWDSEGQHRKSIYYTPYPIANLMVQEVFSALRDRGPTPPHKARVLDPAAGGAVFLVSAFQEIVAEWWRYHQRRPNTREIRQILYHQLSGFEISEPALRLAALSLYLKAIELDIDPHPPKKLRFDPLRGKVLHRVCRSGETEGSTAGSLGLAVDVLHRGAYDVVIGNPPWTSFANKPNLEREILATIRPIVADRLGKEQEACFTIPDKLPDLPFVWRAMEWAKPSGWIALALHGRLLFKGSQGGRKAREDIFSAITVTGILNGADLRDTRVWPRVRAPFCLLFAQNRPSQPEDAFYFSSPHREGLNRQGRMRIDAKAAYPVAIARLRQRPDLLKTLYRGSALDAAVLEKIVSSSSSTVSRYLSPARIGVGYQAKGKKGDPGFLQSLNDLRPDYSGSLLVEPRTLPLFNQQYAHRRRKREVYEAPLVLVRQSPPFDRSSGRALLSFSDLAYNESFYGCSTRLQPEPELLARYLCLIFNSDIFLWHALVTSGKFGIERDALLKEDLDDFPIRPLQDIPLSLKAEIELLSSRLLSGTPEIWAGLDHWAARIYDLSPWDVEVIQDTLTVGLPFASSIRDSQRPPEAWEIAAFASRIEAELSPFARTAGRTLQVRRHEASSDAPWEVLSIWSDRSSSNQIAPIESEELRDLFEQADHEGASQILVVQPEEHRLLLGILRQYRYWTQTRARIGAIEILQNYLGALLQP